MLSDLNKPLYFQSLEQAFIEGCVQCVYDVHNEDTEGMPAVYERQVNSVLEVAVVDIKVDIHRLPKALLFNAINQYHNNDPDTNVDRLRTLFISTLTNQIPNESRESKFWREQSKGYHKSLSQYLETNWSGSIYDSIFKTCFKVYKNHYEKLRNYIDRVLEKSELSEASKRVASQVIPDQNKFSRLFVHQDIYTKFQNKLIELDWVDSENRWRNETTNYLAPIVRFLLEYKLLNRSKIKTIVNVIHDTYQPAITKEAIRKKPDKRTDTYKMVFSTLKSISE